MGIGRCFEEALQKALRMVSDHADGFSPYTFSRPPIADDLEKPTDKRMFALARGMYYGDFDVEKAHQLTAIDRWFLFRMQNIVDIYHRLEKENVSVPIVISFNTQFLFQVNSVSADLLLEAKQAGFSDRQIAKKIGRYHFPELISNAT